ncbi:MAG: tetratricopeptide repeat protein, partial [Bacteroidetes bacterium]|nr:tetratricopeptide repeat protein [Bacteroidota bacterium]
MSMFNFEFEDLEDYKDDNRLKDLAASFEKRGESAYFDSDTLEEIATFYFEQGRYEDSLRVVDRMLHTHPFSSDGWMRQGILLNNLGRHNEALDAYDRALELNPTDVETIVNRGITLDSIDRPGEALDAYADARKMDPNN